MNRAPVHRGGRLAPPLQGMWHPASGQFAMQGHAPLPSQGQHLVTFSCCQELLLSSSSPAPNTAHQTSYRAVQDAASRGSLPILGSHFPLLLGCHSEVTRAKDRRLEPGRLWPGRRLLLELGCPLAAQAVARWVLLKGFLSLSGFGVSCVPCPPTQRVPRGPHFRAPTRARSRRTGPLAMESSGPSAQVCLGSCRSRSRRRDISITTHTDLCQLRCRV